jgi:tryptophan-rich hypothetical protein
MPNKNLLSSKKLLLTKWTAVHPVKKQKHFLVSKLILPELPHEAIKEVEIEAVFTKEVWQIDWRELTDASKWKQGWV